MVIVNKRMNAINKALANAKFLNFQSSWVEEEDLSIRYKKLTKVAESEICGHIALKYRIEYHESIFKPYYDGLVTKDELFLALEGEKFSDIT